MQKFATRIQRMVWLVCRKLREIHGFSTCHVENSFRRVVTNPGHTQLYGPNEPDFRPLSAF